MHLLVEELSVINYFHNLQTFLFHYRRISLSYLHVSVIIAMYLSLNIDGWNQENTNYVRFMQLFFLRFWVLFSAFLNNDILEKNTSQLKIYC